MSAHQISRSEIHESGIPLYDHLVSCCLHHGLDAVPFLDRMMVFDYLIGNTDRHLNNFGVIRDPCTLEWRGFAPLFDNGTSMGCDLEADDIVSEVGLDSKPFSEYFPRQLALVRETDRIDMEAVRGDQVGIGPVLGRSSVPCQRQGRDSEGVPGVKGGHTGAVDSRQGYGESVIYFGAA